MPSLATRLLKDRRLWAVAAVIAVIVAIRLSGAADYLSLDTLRSVRGTLTGWVAEHRLLAALAYMATYVVTTALLLPGAVLLTLTGGFLFGAVIGTGLTVVAATIGAIIIFSTARAVFGANALERFGPRAKALVEGLRRNAWSYLLVLRLVPLFPFLLVNIVPAFAGVRLRVFAITTLFGILPGTAVFSLSGAGLGRTLDSGGALDLGSILTPEILIALCALAALSLAAIPLKARFAPAPAPAPAPATPTPPPA
ncbi:TVP38/TMEM64 family protein [Plastoroseomonas arctica]|uniref:TVP38/TMEM64 family membrane protein n=1 Tax=Plastoroseomonas arctica TaxID=1509237 RepID=A0AAF1K0R2_9PROT|nr:VTT domain-containing protein [Plastoroseomonas arctica]MBR0654185.1 TVP38/TMEM64 family protein [Plastoroseomonas arctica]